MSNNPNNAVGTNAAYAGRTSVNAFNDGMAGYTSGILSGWACAPSSGLTVTLGGNGTTRDVAVAEDNSGNKTSINNISGAPIPVTMAAAPGANSRIDVIVAYVDNPPQGSSTIADNYEACGLIAVQGTAAANPVAPNDSAIRSAITTDGASGTTAYYVVLAYITLASSTTDITSDDITAGAIAALSTASIKHWMPDYAQKSSTNILSSSDSATIADTGFVEYELNYYNTSSAPTVQFKVNGSTVKVAEGFRDINNNFSTSLSGMVPVANGDTISITKSGLQNYKRAYFIPGRWV